MGLQIPAEGKREQRSRQEKRNAEEKGGPMSSETDVPARHFRKPQQTTYQDCSRKRGEKAPWAEERGAPTCENDPERVAGARRRV